MRKNLVPILFFISSSQAFAVYPEVGNSITYDYLSSEDSNPAQGKIVHHEVVGRIDSISEDGKTALWNFYKDGAPTAYYSLNPTIDSLNNDRTSVETCDDRKKEAMVTAAQVEDLTDLPYGLVKACHVTAFIPPSMLKVDTWYADVPFGVVKMEAHLGQQFQSRAAKSINAQF